MEKEKIKVVLEWPVPINIKQLRGFLGLHISDYSTLTLKFYLDKQFVTLHGEKSTTGSLAQFNHLRRMYCTNAIAELFALQPEIPVCPQDDWLDIPRDMEPELAILLLFTLTMR